jgi:hypothetical protein
LQMGTVEGDPGVLRARFVRRLGEAGYGRESGIVGELDLLARTGLPVPEGVVLTRESHREFVETTGLLRDMRGSAGRLEDTHSCALEAQLKYGSTSIEEELNRALCQALINLGASEVVVLSEDLTKSGLKSIPEVQVAVRDAWLSLEGLARQIEAAARGESLPTWPILIQRELYPEYTGWSMAGDLGEGPGARRSDKGRVALYDIRPAHRAPSSDRESIAHVTLEAECLLGGPIQLKWGLKGGRWYILSTEQPSR